MGFLLDVHAFEACMIMTCTRQIGVCCGVEHPLYPGILDGNHKVILALWFAIMGLVAC